MKTELYKRNVKEKIVFAMLDYMSEDDECGYSKKEYRNYFFQSEG